MYIFGTIVMSFIAGALGGIISPGFFPVIKYGILERILGGGWIALTLLMLSQLWQVEWRKMIAEGLHWLWSFLPRVQR